MTAPLLFAEGVNWHTVFFLLYALVAGVMALAVLFTSNIVRMAFYLTISLGAVSGLFILAGAHFVGAMQLLIYVGGTLVLLIFGVMLTAQAQFISMKTRGGEWVLAAIVGGSLLSVLLATALSVPKWRGPSEEHQAAIEDLDVSADTTAIGAGLMGLRPDKLAQEDEQLSRGMSGYLLHFEIVSVHLLVVLIGAAYLARARHTVEGRAAPTARAPLARTRPIFATLILLLAIAAHAGCAAICFIPGATFKTQLPGVALAEPWLWPALGVCCALDALLLLVILNWQKWGFYALLVLALLEAGIVYGAGSGIPAALGTLGVAIVWLAILRGVLAIGGERGMWAQME